MSRNPIPRAVFCAVFPALLCFVPLCRAAGPPTLIPSGNHSAKHKDAPLPKLQPDVIVFTNGDRLTGTFIREAGGTVLFHSDVLGDVSIPWSKIREMHAHENMAVLSTNVTPHHGKQSRILPVGTLSVSGDMITVHPANHAMIQPIPVKNAQYIMDRITLEKQLFGRPGIFAGWNGAFTGGATIVDATQKQRTYNVSVALLRQVPTLAWLRTRNRTTLGFNGSYGKITQPAYVSEGVFYPETDTKSAIYHADAERDEYFSDRFYALGQTAFDHNYSQGLDLQQIYGGGIGYTAIKRSQQELDFKATVQYEKQAFLNATAGINQNLVGSTYATVYMLKLPRGIVFHQQMAYIPAYNNPVAYSATESNSAAIPFYKSLSFSVGTIDSYLNNPPPATPPTLKNSFQFTVGATYEFKTKY